MSEDVSEELKSNIEKAIDQNRPIKVRLYALLPKTEAELSYVSNTILENFEKSELQSTLYTVVKELSLNGAKANIKRILFEEEQVDEDNEEQYSEGLKKFKSKLNERWIYEYAQKAKDKNLYVDVNFDYNDDRLILEVINTSPISEHEDIRIREKFKNASKFDNLGEFYMTMADNTEGAGMGITLILMMLKAEGIDPHSFTIKSDYKTKTIAKVEFPFHQDHTLERDEFNE